MREMKKPWKFGAQTWNGFVPENFDCSKIYCFICASIGFKIYCFTCASEKKRGAPSGGGGLGGGRAEDRKGRSPTASGSERVRRRSFWSVSPHPPAFGAHGEAPYTTGTAKPCRELYGEGPCGGLVPDSFAQNFGADKVDFSVLLVHFCLGQFWPRRCLGLGFGAILSCSSILLLIFHH